MNLGTFKKQTNGTITGTATTLVSSFDLEYRPVEHKIGNAADFRIYRAGTDIEVGFARHSVGEQSGKEYLNSLIDTPEFANGVWAALVKEEDGNYVLKWSRPVPRKKSANGNEAEDMSAAANF